MTEQYNMYYDYHKIELWQGTKDNGKYIASFNNEQEADNIGNLISNLLSENEQLKQTIKNGVVKE